MKDLFLPAIVSWREGQSLDRVMAVEPPTLPVPPNITTRELSPFPPYLGGAVDMDHARAALAMVRFSPQAASPVAAAKSSASG